MQGRPFSHRKGKLSMPSRRQLNAVANKIRQQAPAAMFGNLPWFLVGGYEQE